MWTMMRVVIFAAIALAPAAVSAKTLYVANDGFDELGCGASKSAPCRSIIEAIAQASDRDTIEVGPGAYGDLDGDGVVDPGDEAFEFGPGCSCAIKIDKAVTIISTLGAGSTVIKAGANLFQNITPVAVQSDDVVLGRQNRGFHITVTETLTNLGGLPSGGSGVTIGSNTRNIRVEGNFVTNFDVGISVEGDGHSIWKNSLVNNGFGINLLNSTNVIVSNNTTINNRQYGIQSSCSDGVIEKNQILQNTECGIRTEVVAECKGPTIQQNNIFGNGTPAGIPNLPINCGVLAALTGDTGESDLPDLTGNYWGAADGPGPDPADEAFGVTVSGDEFVISDVFPVAQRPIRIQGIK